MNLFGSFRLDDAREQDWSQAKLSSAAYGHVAEEPNEVYQNVLPLGNSSQFPVPGLGQGITSQRDTSDAPPTVPHSLEGNRSLTKQTI